MPKPMAPVLILRRALSSPTLLAAILFAQLLVGIAAIHEKPLFDDQTDEAGHLNMARFVASQRGVPTQDDVEWNPDTLQFTQPPLYYFLTAPLIALFDDGRPVPGQPNPSAVCHGYNTHMTTWARPANFSIARSGAVRVGYLLRSLQLLFALATTFLTFRCTRILFPQRPEVSVSAAALIAFFPPLVSTTAFIGNDWPVIFLGALSLYVTLRTVKTTTPAQGITGFGMVLIFGLIAAFTKVTGWPVFVLVLPVLGHLLSRTRLTRKVILILLIAAVAAGALIAAFNLRTYGSVIGRYPSTWLNVYLPVHEIIGLTAAEFWNSIVLDKQFNANAVPRLERLSEISLMIMGSSFLWLGLYSIRSPKTIRALSVPLLLLFASIGLVLVRNATAVNALYIFAPFRYLGPGIPALAIVSAAALSALPGPLSKLAMGLIPLSWFVLSVLAATTSDIAVVQRESSVPDRRLPADAIAIELNRAELPFSVAGYALAPTDNFEDGVIDLTLYLTGVEAPGDIVRMLELQADTTACRLVPVRGFRPTTSIAEGDWVAAHIKVPYCGDETETPIPVTLSWRNVSPDGRITTLIDNSTASLMTIASGPARPAPACQPNLGTLGDAFQIIKADFPATIEKGEVLRPSVNWLVRTATFNSYLRVYSLTDASGSEVARCEETPRMGTYPTNEWREGEVVYDDSCIMRLSPSLPEATYDLWIGMIDATTNRYLRHDGSPDRELLHLGSVTITSN